VCEGICDGVHWVICDAAWPRPFAKEGSGDGKSEIVHAEDQGCPAANGGRPFEPAGGAEPPHQWLTLTV